MEGIPDYLDPASKLFNAVMSSLKPDEAAIYSPVEWIEAAPTQTVYKLSFLTGFAELLMRFLRFA
jgi:hypothetical protein